MKKLSRILLALLLACGLLLTPPAALAADSDYCAYNCNYILQQLRIDLCQYLYENGCYREYDPEAALPPAGQKAPSDLTYYIPQTDRVVQPQIPDAEDKLKPSLPAIAQQVVDLVNEERAKVGLGALSIDIDLCEAALVRAEEINSKFSHTRPDGRNCFTALDEAGVDYIRAGENIALGQYTAEEVMEDWMNSPSHKANIVSEKYHRIGVSVIPSTNSRYRGYAWTQEFAD